MNTDVDFDDSNLDEFYASPEYIGSPEYLETVRMLREAFESIRNGEKLFSTQEVFAELRARYGILIDHD